MSLPEIVSNPKMNSIDAPNLLQGSNCLFQGVLIIRNDLDMAIDDSRDESKWFGWRMQQIVLYTF